MTLMELTMIPLDKGSSFSEYVARTLKIIDESGLDYRLNPMGTVIEGELADLTGLLNRCFEALATDSDRISITAKFDYRKGASGRLEGKIRSVENKAGKKLKTS